MKKNKKEKISFQPKTVDEDLKSIRESDLLEEEKKLSPLIKRIILIFSGLLIIFLFISITYLQYPLFGIIQGQIESRSPDNNILELKDFSIYFTDTALGKLSDSFSVNQEVETSRCLKGTLEHDEAGIPIYYINEVYTPKIYDQSFRHVTSEPCSEDTLIMFHTHPYKSCVASSTDLNTLKENQITNPDMIMIIMCEPDRFSTYR